MAHVVSDRVKESAAAAGTGSFALQGAAAGGFQSFASRMAVGDTTWYCATDNAAWEVGVGTLVAGPALARSKVLASSNADALVNFATAPSVFSTAPGSVLQRADVPGTPYPDPARLWFGASGVTVDSVAGNISGEPVVVFDGAQFVMYLFRTVPGAPYVKCYYRTAPTLEGAWSAATEIVGMAGYHKCVILVDEQGAPELVGGSYHAYAVKFDSTLPSKEIYHFTAPSLTGAWTLGTKVIAKGAPGDKDGYNTDAPFALLKNGTIYLWYMGAPDTSLATYGLAERMLRATATDPGGPFVKSADDVMLPSSTAGWDYGWLGGTQILRRPGGSYMMVFNAGDTRPSTPGTEPNTSRIGYAYAPTIDGPWTKDPSNPYVTPTGVPSDGGQTIESTNIWRGNLAYDPKLASWLLFYNTGTGTEKITYGRQGVYDYFDAHSGSPYNIQAVTTNVATVGNTRVNVTPGTYRVNYQFNIGEMGTTKPAVDIDTALRLNGTALRTNRDFIGSYNYENRDTILNYVVTVPTTGYLDCSVQCTGGTPTANTQIRRLRVSVQRIR